VVSQENQLPQAIHFLPSPSSVVVRSLFDPPLAPTSDGMPFRRTPSRRCALKYGCARLCLRHLDVRCGSKPPFFARCCRRIPVYFRSILYRTDASFLRNRVSILHTSTPSLQEYTLQGLDLLSRKMESRMRISNVPGDPSVTFAPRYCEYHNTTFTYIIWLVRVNT